jgi:hypothetical protein
MNGPRASPRSGAAGRLLALTSVAWFAASLMIPATPLWDSLLLLALIFSVGLSGGIWLALALWAALPATAALLAIKRLSERRYQAAAGWLTVPAAAVFLWCFATGLGDMARFRLNKGAYDNVIADARMGKCSMEDIKRWGIPIDGIECHDPITVIFVWGGFVSIWNGVVYDAGDEIIKAPQDRSTGWKKRAIGSLLSCSGAKTALGDHYYRAGGSYTSGSDECG